MSLQGLRTAKPEEARMSFWDTIRQWFGSGDDAAAVTTQDRDDAVAAVPASRSDSNEPAWWIPRGEPVLTAPPPASVAASMDRTLHEYLVKVLDSPNLELPRLPQVASRALQFLREDSVNYRTLSNIIAEDPVLSAEVLRLANSAMFRGVSEITRLDAAFTRLGQRNLRSLILSANVRSMSIRMGGSSVGEQIWKRSFVSAIVASRLSGRVSIAEEDAFLGGLVHNIGELGVLRVVHDFQRDHGNKVSRAVFDQLIDDWHEHLGLRLADAWNLPEPLPAVIGQHHSDPEPDDPNGVFKRLIQFSDVCASMLGYAPYVPYDFFKLPCVMRLGISDCREDCKLLASLPGVLAERMRGH
jgi:HD-like signal output (HDOD) protein